MMRKVFYVLLCLFGLSGILHAQDFEPGKQAKSYLEKKNVSVEYATGVFNYEVPLFEIHSGSYKLPVSLHYTGKGVMFDDHPGLAGYNWNLNCGGVVTRTIRGGVADEKFNVGIANQYWLSSNINETTDWNYWVDNGKDGESDIFTAVFNGQTFHFMIENGGKDNYFKVVPLERSNIKVEIEYVNELYRDEINYYGPIRGWKIIDENGVVYLFRERETLSWLTKRESLSYTSIYDQNYTSSWYISEVQIPGVNPITFLYDGAHPINTLLNRNDIPNDFEQHRQRGRRTYIYGKPMVSFSFDFSKYRVEFEKLIKYAVETLDRERLTAWSEYDGYVAALSKVDKLHMYDPTDLLRIYEPYNRALGTLSEFASVQESLDKALIDLTNVLNSIPPSSISGFYIKGAIQLIEKCYSEKEYIEHTSEDFFTSYYVYLPKLRSISNGYSSLDFHYTDWGTYGCRLDSIMQLNQAGQAEKIVALGTSWQNILHDITWKDNCHREYDKLSFEYYYENLNGRYQQGLWGGYTWADGAQVDSIENISKIYMLKCIKNNFGGELQIDYEPNKFKPESGISSTYAGNRIRSIRIEDGDELHDTISYFYPNPGVSLYKHIDNGEALEYTSLIDRIIFSPIQYLGNVLLHNSQHDLYYSVIEERFSGKGSNLYLYSTPVYDRDSCAVPFWMSGLQLAKGIYDVNGNLVRMRKNRYYMDYSHWFTHSDYYVYDMRKWFDMPLDCLQYTQSKQQIRADKYYLDKSTLENKYSKTQKIGMTGMTEYELYLQNYYPRTSEFRIRPESKYRIYYGGKTLLKEQKEYAYQGDISTSPSVLHFEADLSGKLISDIEYIYDNLEMHTHPTRIVNRTINGDTLIVVRHTPLDMADGIAMVDSMKQRHIYAPIIREQLLKKYNGQDCLLKETVLSYQSVNDTAMLPKIIQYYAPETPYAVTTPAIDTRLFSKVETEYTLKELSNYTLIGGNWLQNAVQKLEDTTYVYYDKLMQQPIMKKVNGHYASSGIVNPYRKNAYRLLVPEGYNYSLAEFYKKTYRIYERFMNFHQSIQIENYSETFKLWYDDLHYKQIVTYIGKVLRSMPYSEVKPLFSEVSESVFVLPLLMGEVKIGSEAYVILSEFYEYMRYNTSLFDSNPTLYEYLSPAYWHYLPDKELEFDASVIATPTASEKRYKLYYVLYSDNTSLELFSPNISVRTSSGSTSHSVPVQMVAAKQWMLLTFDIDLSAYSEVKFIQAEAQRMNYIIALCILVPEGEAFEAIALRDNGLPFCKLNQNEQLEYYDYDGKGRLLRELDLNCNVVQEKAYHDAERLVVTSMNVLASSMLQSSAIQDKIYTDGFGREKLSMMVNASPDKKSDIFATTRYGAFGKEQRKYLPYALTNNGGAIPTNLYTTEHWNLYGTDKEYAYSEIEYETSPLNRPLKQTGAGLAWHTADKCITTEYLFNAANRVVRWRLNRQSNLPEKNGFYAEGALNCLRTTDEDGHQTEAYFVQKNRPLLTVEYDGNIPLETYYVYDIKDSLRWVLSPEATRQMENEVTMDVLDKLAYYYEYDRNSRMTVKCLPGCEPIYMVYDRRNRLVLSQDGNQRTADNKKWSYSVYDGKNRVVESGELLLSSTMTHKQLQDEAWDSENYLPSGKRTVLQYTVYDSYEATSKVTPHTFVAVAGYSSDYQHLVVGLMTSTKTRVLGTETWQTTTIYYDEKCRPIQTVSDNHHGTLSVLNTVYDFVGNVLKQREVNGSNVLETIYAYDNRSRLLNAIYTLNNGTPATVEYEYDTIGRLVTKKYGGNIIEQMTYNVRGWLTSKSSMPFKMQLRYENPQAGVISCYNGNISEWQWTQSTNAEQLYSFTYDTVNRLKEAEQFKKNGNSWIVDSNHYVEKGLTYDRNGNILTLQRTGNGTLVDNLVYTYIGNQLISLQEGIRSTSSSDVYLPGETSNGVYEYDTNGNLIKDMRKGLEFSYNCLNLLSEVKENGIVKAIYQYLADGTKLSVRNGNGNVGYDYDGSFVYAIADNISNLEAAHFADGQIKVEEVNYTLTDHLGSVRAIVDANGTVLEQNDYYPFGSKHMNTSYVSTNNRYAFSGKEEQDLLDLNTYDFGARMYDSNLARWMSVDPLCEDYYFYSLYSYCNNLPTSAIDINGYSTWVINVGDGLYSIFGGDLYDNDKNIYIYGVQNGMFMRLESIGVTTSITSFYNSDNGTWAIGSIIDLKNYSGDVFLTNLIKLNPPMFDDYILNARTGKKYDFKSTNGTNRVDKNLDIYRGMIIGQNGLNQKIITSARDIGNIAAGYIAGVNGMSWEASRVAFDTYQSKVDGHPVIEGLSTRNAERYGWVLGYNQANPIQKVLNLHRSIDQGIKKIWNWIMK